MPERKEAADLEKSLTHEQKRWSTRGRRGRNTFKRNKIKKGGAENEGGDRCNIHSRHINEIYAEVRGVTPERSERTERKDHNDTSSGQHIRKCYL